MPPKDDDHSVITGLMNRDNPMKKALYSLLISITILSASCLHFTEGVSSEDIPSNNSGYIFGFFTMGTYYKKSVVAVLKNTYTGKVRYILFANHPGKPDSTGAVMIPVDEGSYQFVEFLACPAVRSLFTIESVDCTLRQPVGSSSSNRLTQPFTVKKGTIVYAGSHTGISYGINGGKEVVWSADVTMLSQEEAQKHILALYPHFSSLPLEHAFAKEKIQ